jgi:uncharacterized membrane protein YgdD (TMEM256/DUF423 family)
MNKRFLKAAALLGALTVIFGAFAAHAIKSRVNAETLAVFETGVRYQMYHVFGLFLVGILYKEFPKKSMVWAGNLFLSGIILFSGSLYLLTYFKAAGNENMNWLGAVTPFGGTCFIVGWSLILRSFYLPKTTV